MVSKHAMHVDWGKQAKKTTTNYWGGRWADGTGDNYNRNALYYKTKSRNPKTKKLRYTYTAMHRRTWNSYNPNYYKNWYKK